MDMSKVLTGLTIIVLGIIFIILIINTTNFIFKGDWQAFKLLATIIVITLGILFIILIFKIISFIFKNDWNALSVLSKSFSLILIPLVLAVLGYHFNLSLKSREVAVKYVELAINILEKNAVETNEGLRVWAINVVNEYSKVKLSEKNIEFLKKNSIFDSFAFKISNIVNLLLGTSYKSNSEIMQYYIENPNGLWEVSLKKGTSPKIFLIALSSGYSIRLSKFNSKNPSKEQIILGPDSGFGVTGDGTVGSPYKGGEVQFSNSERIGFRLHLLDDYGSTTIDPLDIENSRNSILIFKLSDMAGHPIWGTISGETAPVDLDENTYLIVFFKRYESIEIPFMSYEYRFNSAYLVSGLKPVIETR